MTRLRTARLKSGITQKELASLLNINQSLVSKVESCERRLDIIEFLNWCKVLGVPWDKVIPKKYSMGENTKHE
ncbi:helix-turn-helix domain-containing protein [Tumebacillus flagellatus]